MFVRITPGRFPRSVAEAELAALTYYDGKVYVRRSMITRAELIVHVCVQKDTTTTQFAVILQEQHENQVLLFGCDQRKGLRCRRCLS